MQAVFSALGKTFKKEGRFAYPGSEIFAVKKRKARKGKNPKTGEVNHHQSFQDRGIRAGPLAEGKSLIYHTERLFAAAAISGEANTLIHLLPLGDVSDVTLQSLAASLQSIFGVPAVPHVRSIFPPPVMIRNDTSIPPPRS